MTGTEIDAAGSAATSTEGRGAPPENVTLDGSGGVAVAVDGSSGGTGRADLVARLLALRRQVAQCFVMRIPADLRDRLGSVTVHQMEVLHRLLAGPMTMGELARAIGITESAATALADRMVRQGLVERRADPADRRVVRLVLSPTAAELAGRLWQSHLRRMEEVLSVLSDRQLAAMVDVSETLVRSIPELEGTTL